jgi:hypothetical protein
MLNSRTFHVVFVGDNHGTGIEMTTRPDEVVEYSGKPITVTR